MKYLLIIIFLIPNFSAMAATWKRQYKSQLMTIDPEVTSCPDGYIGIPVLPPYTYRYFCVMKYEAKK